MSVLIIYSIKIITFVHFMLSIIRLFHSTSTIRKSRHALIIVIICSLDPWRASIKVIYHISCGVETEHCPSLIMWRVCFCLQLRVYIVNYKTVIMLNHV